MWDVRGALLRDWGTDKRFFDGETLHHFMVFCIKRYLSNVDDGTTAVSDRCRCV